MVTHVKTSLGPKNTHLDHSALEKIPLINIYYLAIVTRSIESETPLKLTCIFA